MNIFGKILKKVAIILAILAAILVASIFYVSKYPLSFTINSSYGEGIRLIASHAKLTFIQHKFRIIVPKLQIIKPDNQIVILDEIMIAINPWLLTSQLNAKLHASELLPLINQDMAKHNFILFDGEIQANFILTHLYSVQVKLHSENGWNDPLQAGLVRIKLQNCNVDLFYQSGNLQVENFALKYENGITANLSGDFSINKKSLQSAKFTAEINALPIDYLSGLWPRLLFPKIHEWVVTHIYSGIVTQAKGEFNFSPEDLQNSSPSKESIEAVIEVNDASINYLEGFDSIININGVVKFDGDALHVLAKNAGISKNGSISNLELNLPFKSFVLALKANVRGPISQFYGFIPSLVHDKLDTYKINFANIKGNVDGVVDLSIPLSQAFELQNLHLNIAADLENVVVDEYGLIKFKHGKFELLNSQDKIQLKINDHKLLSLELSDYHGEQDQIKNHINIDLVLAIPDKINFNMLELNSGFVKVNTSLKEGDWQAKLDLSEAEIYIAPIGFTKLATIPAFINCNGKIERDIIASDHCNLTGQGLEGGLKFSYVMGRNPQLSISLNNAVIDKNNFSFALNSAQNFSKYNIFAKAFDISNLNFKSLSNSSDASNYQFDLKIDQLICKENIILPDIRGHILKNANSSIDLNINSIANNGNFSLSRALKNGEALYVLHAKPAARYAQAFGIYHDIKNGEIWIELAPTQNQGITVYKGKLNLINFAFSNTSIFTKIIMGVLSPLNSPIAVAQALQGGSVQASSFTADLEYKMGILSIRNGLITGLTYSIKINGVIDFNQNKLNLQGIYIPSTYGINTLIASIPLIGTLLSGGSKSAFIGANFTISGTFDNPKTDFNPFSILTPGFLRNLIP